MTTPDPGSALNGIALPPIDGQTGPVVGKPVSASEVRHNEQRLSDGSSIHSDETERFYRDASGRMRIETSTGVMIFDPVAGFTYELTDHKTYRKYPSGRSAITIAALAHRSSAHSWRGKSKPEPTTLTEELTPQRLSGVSAKGVRVTTTIPAGTFGNDNDLKVVNERWYSDDLKLLLKSSNSDPRLD